MNVIFPNSKGSVCEPGQNQGHVPLELFALLLFKNKTTYLIPPLNCPPHLLLTRKISVSSNEKTNTSNFTTQREPFCCLVSGSLCSTCWYKIANALHDAIGNTVSGHELSACLMALQWSSGWRHCTEVSEHGEGGSSLWAPTSLPHPEEAAAVLWAAAWRHPRGTEASYSHVTELEGGSPAPPVNLHTGPQPWYQLSCASWETWTQSVQPSLGFVIHKNCEIINVHYFNLLSLQVFVISQ